MRKPSFQMPLDDLRFARSLRRLTLSTSIMNLDSVIVLSFFTVLNKMSCLKECMAAQNDNLSEYRANIEIIQQKSLNIMVNQSQ